MGELDAVLGGFLALGLAPQHDGIDQGLRLPGSNVAEGGYELVKVWIHARTAHQFDSGLGLAAVRHALGDFLVGLEVELDMFH